MAAGDTTVGSTPSDTKPALFTVFSLTPCWVASLAAVDSRKQGSTWSLLGIRVIFYHFLLVEGMVSEKGFTAIIVFNYLFLKHLLCEKAYPIMFTFQDTRAIKSSMLSFDIGKFQPSQLVDL